MAGAGNAESAGGGGAAASPFGGLGFFRTMCFLGGFGGGPAGCSIATTGLGSTLVVVGEPKVPGSRTAVTGTGADWNVFSV